ncbi:MAG: hypothetical protein IPN47_08245 [Gemmatimonadetes bacterium]|nr:hypothetical protein [Gemmatimonadota bacterium]
MAQLMQRRQLALAAGTIREQLIGILQALFGLINQPIRTGYATRERRLLAYADAFDSAACRLMVSKAGAREARVRALVH